MRSLFTTLNLSSRDNKWSNNIQILHAKRNSVVHCHQEKPEHSHYGMMRVQFLSTPCFQRSWRTQMWMWIHEENWVTDNEIVPPWQYQAPHEHYWGYLNIWMDCNAQPSGRLLDNGKMMCRNIIMITMECTTPRGSGQSARRHTYRTFTLWHNTRRKSVRKTGITLKNKVTFSNVVAILCYCHFGNLNSTLPLPF
jgi:hypothetical protein